MSNTPRTVDPLQEESVTTERSGVAVAEELADEELERVAGGTQEAVRRVVRDVLTSSPAFNTLPEESRKPLPR